MKVDIGPYPKKTNTPRRVKISVERYDVWSADHTLSLIILAVLQKLRSDTQSACFVNDEDLPVSMRLKDDTIKDDAYYANIDWHPRWEYILDKMIFAFDCLSHIDETEEYPEDFNERIAEGLMLFAKYYRGLWM